MEQAAQQNDSFLSKINVFPVNQQIGQKVLIGSKGPMAGVNNGVTSRRNPWLKSINGAVRLHVPQGQL